MSMQLLTFQTLAVINKSKNHHGVFFIELFLQQQSRYFCQLKKTQELNFGFQPCYFQNKL